MEWYEQEGRITGKEARRRPKERMMSFAIESWPAAPLWDIKQLFEEMSLDLW